MTHEQYMNDNYPFAALTIGQVRQVISELVSKEVEKINLPIQERPLPNTLNIDEAINVLKENGYRVTKSMIYRLSSFNEIPCSRFGRQLVFNRKELIDWASGKTTRKTTAGEEEARILAESANRKRRA